MHVGFSFWSARAVRFLVLASLIAGVVSFGGSVSTAGAADCALPGPIGSLASTPSAGATPLSAPPQATPVSTRDELKAGLTNLVQAVSACRSNGDFETMSKLVTEKYLGQVYGGGPRMSRDTFLAIADNLPTPKVRFRGFDDLSVTGPGEARANVLLIVGNQLLFQRLTFIEEPKRPGNWLIDGVEPLRVKAPRDHATLRLTITGNRYSPDALTADSGTVNIHVSNSDKEDHELLVLKLADGVTTNDLLTSEGPGFPEGVTYLGQVTIPAHGSGSMVLVGLKTGTYSVVDLLPSDNGVPHLAVGMSATLTVTGQ
jgi:hypothetical protein